MTDRETLERLERWLAEGQEILASVKAGGAQSALPHGDELDAWANVDLTRDCVSIEQASGLSRCSPDTIRNRIREETEFVKKTGQQRKLARMINGRWWLRRDLLKALGSQTFR